MLLLLGNEIVRHKNTRMSGRRSSGDCGSNPGRARWRPRRQTLQGSRRGGTYALSTHVYCLQFWWYICATCRLNKGIILGSPLSFVLVKHGDMKCLNVWRWTKLFALGYVFKIEFFIRAWFYHKNLNASTTQFYNNKTSYCRPT